MKKPEFRLSKTANENGTTDAVLQIMNYIRDLEKRINSLEKLEVKKTTKTIGG